MKTLIIASFFIAVSSAAFLSSKTVKFKDLLPEQRIVGGELASSGQFPYQAALYITGPDGNAWFCGGSIISDQWILTAAHCPQGSVKVEVTLGSTNFQVLESTYQRFEVTDKSAMVIHPEGGTHDIALIKLPSKINFTSHVSPIKLAARADPVHSYDGDVAIASGWGKTSDAALTAVDDLHFAPLTVISNEECSETFNADDSTLCTSTKGKISVCSGDSGGPLVSTTTNEQIGIASFVSAKGCEKEEPAGFVRVTFYLDWIKNETGLDV